MLNLKTKGLESILLSLVWSSLFLSLVGCTPEEKDHSKTQAIAEQQEWKPAKAQPLPLVKPAAAPQAQIPEQLPPPVPLTQARTTPLKEPEAVNGLLPFIEATPKLSELTIIKDLYKQAQGKVQVIEFFNYPCRWCAHIDPTLQAWLRTKPKDVMFIRIPVLFHPNWAIFSKAYYLIETIAKEQGIKDTAPIHAALFEKVTQNLNMGHDLSAMYAFFVEQGLVKPNTEPAFIEKLSNTDDHADLFFAYRIKAIPTFVVHGKKGIYSTNINASGSAENVFKVIDYLTAINR